MGLLLLIMILFPEKGIPLGNQTLEFPSTKDFFALNTPIDSLSQEDLELKKLLDSTVAFDEIDSEILRHKLDSVKHILDSIKKASKHIQGNEKALASLMPFFTSLDKSQNKKIRILHYGDSQIESDRITSYLRNEFQKRFGGNGVGLFQVIPVSPKWTLNNQHSENWERFVAYGKTNPAVKHKKYGALMSFCRFAPIVLDSITDNQESYYEGWIKIKKSKISYNRVKKYSQINIYLSNSNYEIEYDIIVDGHSTKSGLILPNTSFQKIHVNFTPTPEEVEIIFKGYGSPNILGISLEGNNGIVMDNIPLRGSSGTLFTRQNTDLLSQMYGSLKPDLILLEFGGNTVPHIKTDKQVKAYGRWFKNQVNYLKRLNPNTPIIVIGPADMSFKDKTEYITQPYLEPVRDALKGAAISSDCLFWDMYEGMGGNNSMTKWVNSEPALGASDHIHLTPKGAVKIAEIFKTELFSLYDAYKLSGNKEIKIVNDSIH